MSPPLHIPNSERGTLGEMLRSHRLARGMSQIELATAAGVASGTVANYEVGNRSASHGIDSLTSIMQALGLTEQERQELLAAANCDLTIIHQTPVDAKRHTLDAIDRDPNLTSEQRAALKTAYRKLTGLGRRSRR